MWKLKFPMLAAVLSFALGSLEAEAATTDSPATFARSTQPDMTSEVVRSSFQAEAAIAKKELLRAIGILQEFEHDQSHAFTSYLEFLEVRTAPLRGRTIDGEVLRYLNATLSAARVSFENEILDVHTWRRFARASDPHATVRRVPSRFVSKARVAAEPLGRLSQVERSIWLVDS